MKHVMTSANDYVSVEDSTTDIKDDQYSKDTPTTTTTPNSSTKINKKKFQERWYEVFVQMVEKINHV